MKVPSPDASPSLDSDPWAGILDIARWSASPHNIQAWRFRRIDDRRLEILYDPRRLLPGTDPTGFFTLVGFGILFKNMEIAAASRGWDLAVEYHGAPLDSNAAGPTFLARATLQASSVPTPFDASLIKTRRTSRRPYNEQPADRPLLGELSGIAKRYGHTFTFTENPSVVGWLLALNRDTLFYDMADPVARREVGSWIRYGRRQGERRRDGLWSVCLGFPGWLLWTFVHARWFFELPGVRGLIRGIYDRTMRGTRTIGWIAGPCEDRLDAMHAGRMLAELWLAMTRAGVYLHPFGSIITNEKAHARLAECIRTDESQGRLWLVVRLGRSSEPPRSLRLSLAELMEP